MPTFDYAPTNVIRYLSDGSRADIIHYIIVTGPENFRISAPDFPIRIAGANIPDSEIGSLANSASGPASGEPRANLVEEADPGVHGQVDSREADVGNEHNLSSRCYPLGKVPATRYLYWSGLPATHYIPKSCLFFHHQAESATYRFEWGAMARGSVVYLCYGDGKVESLAPGDPIVAGLTFTRLGEPLDDPTRLDRPGLVTVSPGCYQADLFIDRLMGMNGFGPEDGFDTSKDEAIPLLPEVASVSKENISFCKNNSPASYQNSNLSGRLVHRSLVISMENTNASNKPSSQPTIRPMSNAGAREALDDKSVTRTSGLHTAESPKGFSITKRPFGSEASNDQGTHIGGAGVSVLTSSFAALHYLNPNPTAQAEAVMPVYPSVFSSAEQISTLNEGDKREVCTESPKKVRRWDHPADWGRMLQDIHDRAPPFFFRDSPPPNEGRKRFRQKSKHPIKGAEKAWPPDKLIKGFEPTGGIFCLTPLEIFKLKVEGGVWDWGAFPPVQVAEEFLPDELKHLDWTGREREKGEEGGRCDKDGGKQDPILQKSSPPPINGGTCTWGNSDSNGSVW